MNWIVFVLTLQIIASKAGRLHPQNNSEGWPEGTHVHEVRPNVYHTMTDSEEERNAILQDKEVLYTVYDSKLNPKHLFNRGAAYGTLGAMLEGYEKDGNTTNVWIDRYLALNPDRFKEKDIFIHDCTELQKEIINGTLFMPRILDFDAEGANTYWVYVIGRQEKDNQKYKEFVRNSEDPIAVPDPALMTVGSSHSYQKQRAVKKSVASRVGVDEAPDIANLFKDVQIAEITESGFIGGWTMGFVGFTIASVFGITVAVYMSREDKKNDKSEDEVRESGVPRIENKCMEKITHEDWTVLRIIGAGTFARVYLALNQREGNQFVVKSIYKNGKDSEKLDRNIAREVKAMETLEHPNIVKYLGCHQDTSHYFIYMEYVSGGTLHDICFGPGNVHQPLIASVALRYARQVIGGVAYLHENNVIHRDIKPQNVLLSVDGVCKVADFGGCFDLSSDKTPLSHLTGCSIVGTPLFIAPEVVRRDEHTRASDIWSFGIMVFHIMTGLNPYEHLGINETQSLLFFLRKARKLFDLPWPEGTSKSVRELVAQCVEIDVENRTTAKALVEILDAGLDLSDSNSAVVIRPRESLKTPLASLEMERSSPNTLKGSFLQSTKSFSYRDLEEQSSRRFGSTGIQRLKMPEETIKTGTLGNWEWASEASDEQKLCSIPTMVRQPDSTMSNESEEQPTVHE